MKKNSLFLVSALILVSGIWSFTLLAIKGFFTTFNTAIYSNVLTPFTSLSAALIYFLTLLHLINSKNDDLFLVITTRIEDLKRSLSEKKFKNIRPNDKDETLAKIYNDSSGIDFYSLYEYYLMKFHNLYQNTENKKELSGNGLYLSETNKLHIIGDKIPQELREIIAPVSIIVSQISTDYDETDEFIRSLHAYNTNPIHALSIKGKINTIYKSLNTLFERYNEKGYSNYIIVYKDKEYTFSENQIPKYFSNGTFKPILDKETRLKEIYLNYKVYLNTLMKSSERKKIIDYSEINLVIA